MSRDIPLSEIRPNAEQPRRRFVGLEELAESLKAKGQLTPALVRPVDGGYELVHGERRWRAAKLAGLSTLRAEVREMSDDEAFHLALVENIQRDDLTPIEEAEAYQRLASQGIKQADIGALVGKTQSAVAQKLRLLRAPEPLRVLVAQGALSEGHVRELLRLKRLYPSGIERNLTYAGDAPPVTTKELALAYNVLRVEDNPSTPLWHYPCDEIENSPHRQALVDSYIALLSYPDHVVPQWEVAAWWWASAAVVFEFPVVTLSRAIDYWHERFVSGLMYIALHPDPPEKAKPKRGPREKMDTLWWWGAHSDVRHSGCSDAEARVVTRYLWSGQGRTWEVGRGLMVNGFVAPSSLQEWGNASKVYSECRAAISEDWYVT